jgi:hypothetical protein
MERHDTGMPDSDLLRDLRRPYRRPQDDDAHPHANFRAEVAAHTLEDPLATLENLSRDTGIPVGSLVRYVLCRWAASGSEALLGMGPVTFEQMESVVSRAQEAGTMEAKAEGFAALAEIVGWLRAGIDRPAWRVS